MIAVSGTTEASNGGDGNLHCGCGCDPPLQGGVSPPSAGDAESSVDSHHREALFTVLRSPPPVWRQLASVLVYRDEKNAARIHGYIDGVVSPTDDRLRKTTSAASPVPTEREFYLENTPIYAVYGAVD